MEDKNKKTGYKFIKYEYDHPEISSPKVEFSISNQDITWVELLEHFASFIRGSGFIPPEGDLIWLEKNEVVTTKAEAVLYGKSKEEHDLDEK